MNMKECRHGPVRKDDDDVVDWIEGGCSFGAYGVWRYRRYGTDVRVVCSLLTE